MPPPLQFPFPMMGGEEGCHHHPQNARHTRSCHVHMACCRYANCAVRYTCVFFLFREGIQNNIREVGKMAILLYWRCGGAALLFNMAVNVLPPAANVLPPRYWG